MSGIINQVGAKSGIISSGGSASAGTVTLSGTTGLDYEEGTWIPASTTSTSGTGGVAQGDYIKIGKLVIASGNMTFTASSSGVSGTFSGLPFTSKSNAGTNPVFGGSLVGTGIDFEASDHTVNVVPYVNVSSTGWTFYHMGNNSSWSNNLGINSSDRIIFQIIYYTD
jgi:hypothetical protein